MTSTHHFSCTMCGKCCHDLRLPVDTGEALQWIRNGGEVQVLCEAIPWPADPENLDGMAGYKRERSVAAISGGLPVRVVITLVAAFEGACPHLEPDMKCGAYEVRPRVCRIYPAEVNPFVPFVPMEKACPPQAWAPSMPRLMTDGTLVDAPTAALVAHSRQVSVEDMGRKAWLCHRLGVFVASLANEGFAVHTPPSHALESALVEVQGMDVDAGSIHQEWIFLTNRSPTRDVLQAAGALAVLPGDGLPDTIGYLPFHPAG
ncbi:MULTISPECIES: YkgJ family cysteine cluster protein [Pandoraea]|uniref:YkgJ family cysteine cluster protein n=1 Tax=Pandoraea TaxID=93217 RepID=UPI001F5C52BB|nr:MULTISPECIES: YkgJ family cysteine cluster protein [Pandoraea]MCI3206769.1 zinc/iron-chelating domain-containing protein [Pandoraea sp. LA3]MDN4584797.1 zinc/iron-chelating domain-containing protein [Pandoraea capi]